MNSPLKKAVLASFLVYLLPLIGPHTLQPFGVVIAMELTEGVNQ